MPKRTISFDEVLSYLENLPYNKFKEAVNHYSIHNKANFEKDFGFVGINHRTLFLWKHKLIHALASISMPKLTGIIQIDETFIREAQKGSRKLEYKTSYHAY